MLLRTEGIVLRTIPFGEADLIVSYLTSDFGLLNTFAKSPRKTKSRFGSSLEPFTHSKIAFWGKENASFPRLIQSDIIHPFQSIRDSLNCFLRVAEIVELTLQFIPEREENKKVYSLLLHTLHTIEENYNSTLIFLYYKIKLLKFEGYAPKIDACGRCGMKGYSFYASQGSILCDACAERSESTRIEMISPVRLSQGAVKLYSVLLTWDSSKIKKVKPSEVIITELSDMVEMHVKHLLTRMLKSQEFIHFLSQSL